MKIWTDDGIYWKTPRNMFNNVDVEMNEQEVHKVLYGPDGKPIKFLVAERKLPIGFQREKKK